MDKILINIPYLEDSDINPDASLKPSVCKGKPVLLMVQGNFCGYCTKAKPAFQKCVQMVPEVVFATVQTDGSPSERKASQMLSAVNKSPGVPAYLGFDKNGKFVGIHNRGRDVQDLKAFCQTLLR
jgi:thiol-disulfide isomerase/thioredoxin